jgi:hypothetical protein
MRYRFCRLNPPLARLRSAAATATVRGRNDQPKVVGTNQVLHPLPHLHLRRNLDILGLQFHTGSIGQLQHQLDIARPWIAPQNLSQLLQGSFAMLPLVKSHTHAARKA